MSVIYKLKIDSLRVEKEGKWLADLVKHKGVVP